MISYLADVKKELLASLLVQWRALAKSLSGTESLHVKNSKLGSTPGPPHDFSVSSLQGDRVSSVRRPCLGPEPLSPHLYFNVPLS